MNCTGSRLTSHVFIIDVTNDLRAIIDSHYSVKKELLNTGSNRHVSCGTTGNRCEEREG